MAVVAQQGAKHLAKQEAKRQMKKRMKKEAMKRVKKKMKDKMKKKMKDKMKKKAKQKIKKKAKEKLKKKAKKKMKEKAKKKMKQKAKKKMKDKAKKKMKQKAKKRMKNKFKKKVKEKVKEKAEEKVEEYIDDATQRLIGTESSDEDVSYDDTGYEETEYEDYEEGTLEKPKKSRPSFLSGLCRTLFSCCFCCCCRQRKKKKRKERKPEPCCNCKICRAGTYANEVAKNIVGFLTGSLLMFVFYCVFRFAMHNDISQAITQTIGLGLFLTFGMAFSRNVRCLVFLMLPSLFSSKGRTMLMAYAFILVLSGPMDNLTYNMNVATRSQTCGTALAMNQTKQMFELATAPVASILDGVKQLISQLKVIIHRVHQAFQAIVDAVQAVGRAIQGFFDWLGGMVERCNAKMGAPAVLCRKKITDARERCRKKLVIKKICDVIKPLLPLCEVAGMGRLLCLWPTALHFVVKSATRGIKGAIDELERQFYVDFDISHNFTFSKNASKTPNQIKDAIIEELDERTRTFRLVLEWCSRLLSFTFLYLFYKSWRYRSKYLSKDKFDNWYITDYFLKIDRRRQRRMWDNVLPLSKREKRKFIKPCSTKLARPEKIKLILGLIFWFSQVYNATLILFADYCAFWFLDMVRRHTELKVSYAVIDGSLNVMYGSTLLATTASLTNAEVYYNRV